MTTAMTNLVIIDDGEISDEFVYIGSTVDCWDWLRQKTTDLLVSMLDALDLDEKSGQEELYALLELLSSVRNSAPKDMVEVCSPAWARGDSHVTMLSSVVVHYDPHGL